MKASHEHRRQVKRLLQLKQNNAKQTQNKTIFFVLGLFQHFVHVKQKMLKQNRSRRGSSYLSIKVLTLLSNTAVSSTLRNMQTAFLTATHHIYDSHLFLILDT